MVVVETELETDEEKVGAEKVSGEKAAVEDVEAVAALEAVEAVEAARAFDEAATVMLTEGTKWAVATWRF